MYKKIASAFGFIAVLTLAIHASAQTRPGPSAPLQTTQCMLNSRIVTCNSTLLKFEPKHVIDPIESFIDYAMGGGDSGDSGDGGE